MRFVLSILFLVIFSTGVFGQAAPPPVRSIEEEAEIIYQRLKTEEEAASRKAAAERIARARLERERQAEFAGSRAGERKVLTISGVEYPFRFCPAGEFMMGSPASEADRDNDETQHRVTLTKGFWMLETEVTQAMWESVMGSNPSTFKGKKLPVEQVNCDDCQEFIQRLNSQTKPVQGLKFSLPTESQWEYACRAGTTGAYYFGDDWRELEQYGWYSGHKDFEEWKNSKEFKDDTFSKWGFTTHPVGTKKPNAWGLYDMHGNVFEWCSDWYGDYPNGSVTDPIGAATGSGRVLRGGSWCLSAWFCRSASRSGYVPSFRCDSLGVRLSLVSE